MAKNESNLKNLKGLRPLRVEESLYHRILYFFFASFLSSLLPLTAFAATTFPTAPMYSPPSEFIPISEQTVIVRLFIY
jgi:hypothetical protein